MGKYLTSFDLEREIRLPQRVLLKDTYEQHIKRFAIVAAALPPEIIESTVGLLETYAGQDDLEREAKKA